jgi:hypothetical protein
VGLAAVAMVGLGACSEPPGAALSVNGHTFPEDALPSMAEDLASYIVGSEISADQILTLFVQGALVDEAIAAVNGQAITEEEAAAALDAYIESSNAAREQQGMEPLPAAPSAFDPALLVTFHGEVLNARLANGEMVDELEALNDAYLDIVSTADIKVNPRFGQWDPNTGVIPMTYPWRVSAQDAGSLIG